VHKEYNITEIQIGVKQLGYYKATSTKIKSKLYRTRMWANAQPDGRPAEHRWRPLFKAGKFA